MTQQAQVEALASWLERGGWPSYIPQEAAAELRRLHVENDELRKLALDTEFRRADEKLRADNMSQQHDTQAALNREAREQLTEEIEGTENWRRLALQFDGHRMQALWHLRTLLEHPTAHAPAVTAFLAAPPLDGESVLAARIAALTQQAVPLGWKLVPVEPTKEMVEAYLSLSAGFQSAHTDWKAMLAAAPTPPAQERKPLTDEQIHELWASGPELLTLSRAIERAHKIGVEE